jgi:hypothetical protein
MRGVPFGYGFNLVTCPNYTFEILAWISICVMTGSFAGAFLPFREPRLIPWFRRPYVLTLPRFVFPSVAVHGSGCIPNGIMGEEETRQLQEGIWEPIPQRQKDPRPVHLLISPNLTACGTRQRSVGAIPFRQMSVSRSQNTIADFDRPSCERETAEIGNLYSRGTTFDRVAWIQLGNTDEQYSSGRMAYAADEHRTREGTPTVHPTRQLRSLSRGTYRVASCDSPYYKDAFEAVAVHSSPAPFPSTRSN